MLTHSGTLEFIEEWRANVSESFAKERGKNNEQTILQLQKTLSELVKDDEDLVCKFHRWIEEYEGSRNPQVWMFRKHLKVQRHWEAPVDVQRPNDSGITSLTQLTPEQLAERKERIARIINKVKHRAKGMLTKEAIAARGVEQEDERIELTGVALEDMGEDVTEDVIPW